MFEKSPLEDQHDRELESRYFQVSKAYSYSEVLASKYYDLKFRTHADKEIIGVMNNYRNQYFFNLINITRPQNTENHLTQMISLDEDPLDIEWKKRRISSIFRQLSNREVDGIFEEKKQDAKGIVLASIARNTPLHVEPKPFTRLLREEPPTEEICYELPTDIPGISIDLEFIPQRAVPLVMLLIKPL